ncbi:hypothetical protein ACFLSZ_02675 [Candidatus Bipolaricaulota bacterium]
MYLQKRVVSLAVILVILTVPLLAASIPDSTPTIPLVPLPQSPETSDEDLLLAEGEFWWFVVGLVIGGGARAVYENWFDEDYGIDKDDLRGIAGTALASGIGGGAAGMVSAISAFIP